MRIWSWLKNKLFREPTKEEVQKILLDRFDLELSLLQAHGARTSAGYHDHRANYREYLRLTDQFLDKWSHKLVEEDA